MDRILLFEDENQKIEIDGMLDYYVNKVFIPFKKVPENFLKITLDNALKELKTYGYFNEKKEVIYWSKAPIFQMEKFIKFSKPYDIFEPAQEYICSCVDENGDYNFNILELLELYRSFLQEGEDFFPVIFPKLIQGIKGYFAFTTEEKVVIMFWTIDGKDGFDF